MRISLPAYGDALESPLDSYGINGVSMTFDASRIVRQGGVTVSSEVYVCCCRPVWHTGGCGDEVAATGKALGLLHAVILRLTSGPQVRTAPRGAGNDRDPLQLQRKAEAGAGRRAPDVTLEGTLLFPGDIAPGPCRTHRHGGDRRPPVEHLRGSRARNPDGTVNFTQLEVM